MNRLFRSLFLVAAAILAGCDLADSLTDASDRAGVDATGEGLHKLMLGYEIDFQSRLFDGQQTTFTYDVTRPGSGEPALTFFFIESPACAGSPLRFSPTNSGSLDTEGALSGIRWNAPGLQPGQTASFSVTYAGDVPLGFITVAVRHSGTTRTDQHLGACKADPDLVNISGAVFVDADASATLDPGIETGVGKVTVVLLDGTGDAVSSTTTAPDGSYLFQVPMADYSLTVPEHTASTTDFNEKLYFYFDATTPTTLALGSVNADSPGHDFGFSPDTKRIIDDLKSGAILTKTKKASWWTRELRYALSGTGKTRFTAGELGAFLVEIETLLLPDVFDFDDANPFEHAFNILSRPVRSDQEALEQVLLAAELNFVAGFGSEAPELDLALFAFAESEWVANFAAAKLLAGGTSSKAAAISSTSLLRAYNDSGTGTGSGSGSLKRGSSEVDQP